MEIPPLFKEIFEKILKIMENEEIKDTFKDRLVKELYLRGMTYKSFAEMVGISISSLNMYLYKGSMPAADVAVRMARVLGVSAEYLILGDSIPNSSNSAKKELSEILDGFSEREAECFLRIAEEITVLRGGRGDT